MKSNPLTTKIMPPGLCTRVVPEFECKEGELKEIENYLIAG